MKRIELKGLYTSIFYDKLPNGLEVYLIPYANKNNYYMTYATKFGSIQTEFVPVDAKGKMKKVPDGIAHFLEHKMFEQEDGVDPFTFYAKTGTGANASTTFDSTQYLCYGTQNLEENLEYLLDYVDAPYFTLENVEKEKGIISEEIKMYDDIPEWVLEEELRKSIYHVHPMRIDIAGTVEEINKITKEDLYTCYNTYYRPDNMFLIVAGKFDPERIMKLVGDNQAKKEKKANGKIKEKDYDEKIKVKERHKELSMNVVIPKVGYGVKFDRNKINIKDDHLLDIYLHMFTTLVLGLSSDFREEARNKQLMSSFYLQWEGPSHFKTLLIMADTNKPQEFLKDLKEALSHIEIKDEDVERMKRVWISSEVQMVDIIESTVNNIYDDIIKYGHIIPDKVDIIRKLNAKELNQIIKQLDFENYSEVIINPN